MGINYIQDISTTQRESRDQKVSSVSEVSVSEGKSQQKVGKKDPTK